MRRSRVKTPRPEPVRVTALFFGAAAGAHAIVAFIAFLVVTADEAARVTTDFAVIAPVVLAAPTTEVRLAVAGLATLAAVLSWRAAFVLARLDPRADRPAANAAWLSLLNPPFGTLFGLLALAGLATPAMKNALAWGDPEA